MERQAADELLEGHELVPLLEGNVLQAKELERRLLAQDIPVLLSKPPEKACCAGGCGCGSKLQLLVREEDVPKVGRLMQAEWLEAVRREGTLDESAMGPQKVLAEGEEPPCPACGFAGPLQEGACADCGLQLE
ncbi:MAG: hypothetical protein AB1730_00060 [Myxococcota bacterium]|jgi:hypothetical protein